MTDEMKLRFLIVDDEQSIRRLCMTVGQGLGYVCAEAETAESALEALEMNPPDLIVTDLKLPSLSGTDLLRNIFRNQVRIPGLVLYVRISMIIPSLPLRIPRNWPSPT